MKCPVAEIHEIHVQTHDTMLLISMWMACGSPICEVTQNIDQSFHSAKYAEQCREH